MKKALLLFVALSIGYLVNAQTVENITVTPKDDIILISFRIGGSTNTQSYNVVLSCSMDGGPRFEPRSLKGDFGNNIRGGRNYYEIEWDVFQDVDRVGEAEFFVKVDLISDMSVPVTTPQNQPVRDMERQSDPVYPDFNEISAQKKPVEWKGYFAYAGSTQTPLGISFGSLKKTGTYGSFRYGADNTDIDTHIWGTIMAGFTRFIYHSNNYRLHGYLGVGITLEYYDYDDGYYYDNWDDNYFAAELGLSNTIGRLYLSLGMEFVNYSDEYYGKFNPVFGLGFAF